MDETIEFSGYFAAHAVWSVSDGETLIPLVAFETPDGKRQMKRLVAKRIEDGVAQGKEWMATNPDGAVRAVLIYDAFITLERGRTDALVVTARDFAHGNMEMTLAVPYRAASDSKGFAVHRPKLLDFKGTAPDANRLTQALWRGIAKHEKGAAVWNAHLDESE